TPAPLGRCDARRGRAALLRRVRDRARDRIPHPRSGRRRARPGRGTERRPPREHTGRARPRGPARGPDVACPARHRPRGVAGPLRHARPRTADARLRRPRCRIRGACAELTVTARRRRNAGPVPGPRYGGRRPRPGAPSSPAGRQPCALPPRRGVAAPLLPRRDQPARPRDPRARQVLGGRRARTVVGRARDHAAPARGRATAHRTHPSRQGESAQQVRPTRRATVLRGDPQPPEIRSPQRGRFLMPPPSTLLDTALTGPTAADVRRRVLHQLLGSLLYENSVRAEDGQLRCDNGINGDNGVRYTFRARRRYTFGRVTVDDLRRDGLEPQSISLFLAEIAPLLDADPSRLPQFARELEETYVKDALAQQHRRNTEHT